VIHFQSERKSLGLLNQKEQEKWIKRERLLFSLLIVIGLFYVFIIITGCECFRNHVLIYIESIREKKHEGTINKCQFDTERIFVFLYATSWVGLNLKTTTTFFVLFTSCGSWKQFCHRPPFRHRLAGDPCTNQRYKKTRKLIYYLNK